MLGKQGTRANEGVTTSVIEKAKVSHGICIFHRNCCHDQSINILKYLSIIPVLWTFINKRGALPQTIPHMVSRRRFFFVFFWSCWESNFKRFILEYLTQGKYQMRIKQRMYLSLLSQRLVFLCLGPSHQARLHEICGQRSLRIKIKSLYEISWHNEIFVSL